MKLDFRIEGNLKSFIQNLATKAGWTLSSVVVELAWVGIGVKKAGEVEIVGPFGLRRLLSKLDLGGRRERLTILVQEDLVNNLDREFGENPRSALREAIRLGTLVFMPNMVKVRGPFGMERPFAMVEIAKIKDNRAKEALTKLQGIQV